MSTLESLNKKYVEIIEKIEKLQLYYRKIDSEQRKETQNAVSKSLAHMKNMIHY